jgi:hypothetical protein
MYHKRLAPFQSLQFNTRNSMGMEVKLLVGPHLLIGYLSTRCKLSPLLSREDDLIDIRWANNKPIMTVSCASQGVENNSEEEMNQMKSAILELAAATQVDSRFILATIMEESTGCVRVKTTRSPKDLIINPGIMQDHQGTGSCEGIPAPCPEAQIRQMIVDGTSGTASIANGGDGLQQTLQKAAAFGTDAQAVYVAARIYNSGSFVSGKLEVDAATACYSSDIANLLVGFAGAESPCKLGTA